MPGERREKSREGAAALVVLRSSLAEAVPAEGPGGPSVVGTRSGCCEGQGAVLWGCSGAGPAHTVTERCQGSPSQPLQGRMVTQTALLCSFWFFLPFCPAEMLLTLSALWRLIGIVNTEITFEFKK